MFTCVSGHALVEEEEEEIEEEEEKKQAIHSSNPYKDESKLH